MENVAGAVSWQKWIGEFSDRLSQESKPTVGVTTKTAKRFYSAEVIFQNMRTATKYKVRRSTA